MPPGGRLDASSDHAEEEGHAPDQALLGHRSLVSTIALTGGVLHGDVEHGPTELGETDGSGRNALVTNRDNARVPGRGVRRADAEDPWPLPVTVAWRQHGEMSGDRDEVPASLEFPGPRMPFVDTMIMPAPIVALVSTYPPTVCGLATFTSNLSAAIAAPESGWRSVIVRVVDQRRSRGTRGGCRPVDRRRPRLSFSGGHGHRVVGRCGAPA